MHLTSPWFLAAAGVVATIALVRLFRPARLRVVVSHRFIWDEALARVGRQRSWRRPRLWMLLAAMGGLSVVGAAGGAMWAARRAAPPPVLVLIGQTPQLAGPEGDRLLERMRQLLSELDLATPVRIVGSRGLAADRLAGDWLSNDQLAKTWRPELNRFEAMRRTLIPESGADLDNIGAVPDEVVLEQSNRRPGDAMVYLFGRFRNVPPNRPDLQWLFYPTFRKDDIGIAAAGAARVGDHVEVYVELRRFAGAGRTVTVSAGDVDRWAVGQASPPQDMTRQSVARLVMTIPTTQPGPIAVTIDGKDDQPANDRAELSQDIGGWSTTAEVIGRPNEWIERALRSSSRTAVRQTGGPPPDWVIVNEPVDSVAAGPEQGLVLIDPLVMPAGIRLTGELRDTRIASHSADAPWRDVPLDGLPIGRASQVTIDSRWKAVASDPDGHPLVAWNQAARVLALFFSVAADNVVWHRQASWPVFWETLDSLTPGMTEGIRLVPSPDAVVRWRSAGTWAPDAFVPDEPAGPIAATIQRPASQSLGHDRPVWRWLALAGAVLLSAGWLLRGHDPM